MDKGIELICGDAITELKKLGSNTVDLVITDPPYNLNKDYGEDNDTFEFDEYIEFSKQWLKQATRVLKQNGTIYVFMGMKYISYIYSILEKELGFYFNSWITWFYTQGIGKTRGFSPRHDDILMFTKDKKDFVFDLDSIRVPQKYYRAINNMRGANPGNVWEFSHVHYCNKNRKLHPTQKPEGLYERMILVSSKKDALIVDPFLGSGTAARVCQQLNRRCIGIDINPQYIEMTVDRLNQPFTAFDSIDEKMKRCPNDLNDPIVRLDYIEKHIKWFLNNHSNAIKEFLEEVKKKYLEKMIESNQLGIFEEYGVSVI